MYLLFREDNLKFTVFMKIKFQNKDYVIKYLSGKYRTQF